MNYGGIGFIAFCLLATFGSLIILLKIETAAENKKANLLQQKRPQRIYN